MPDEDRIAQLASATGQTAAEVETHSARLVELQSRLVALDGMVRAVGTAQSDTADRVERVASELDVSAQVASLATQLAAARELQHQTAARVEAVSAQLDRIERFETSLGQVAREAAAQVDDRAESLRAEIRAMSVQHSSEQAASGRAIAGLVRRIDELAVLKDAVAATQRRIVEADAVHGRLAARVEEVAAERQPIKEELLAADRRQMARNDGFAAEVADLRAEVDTWRARIDAQTELLRAARAVADEMSEQAHKLRDAHHSTAEAQRVAEERLDSTLQAMREEAARGQERLVSERRNDWQALELSRAARGEELSGLTERLDALAEDLASELRQLSDRLADQKALLATLRGDVAVALRALGAAWSDATEQFELGLPEADRQSQQAEWREATRRALRAQRAPRDI